MKAMSKSYMHSFMFMGALRRFIFVTEDDADAKGRWDRALKSVEAAAERADDQKVFWDELLQIMKGAGFHPVRE
jgi:hypothetical protein